MDMRVVFLDLKKVWNSYRTNHQKYEQASVFIEIMALRNYTAGAPMLKE